MTSQASNPKGTRVGGAAPTVKTTRADVAKLNRARIIQYVKASPGQCVVEIAIGLSMPRNNVQQYCHHLWTNGEIRKVHHVRADGIASYVVAWAHGFGDDQPLRSPKSLGGRNTAEISHRDGQVHRVNVKAVQVGMWRIDCVAALFGPARTAQVEQA